MGSRQAPESQEEPPPSPKCLKGSLMEGLSDPAHLTQAWRDWGGGRQGHLIKVHPGTLSLDGPANISLPNIDPSLPADCLSPL